MSQLVDLTMAGLSLGLLYGLAAIGLSLTYRTTGIINLAHGHLIMLGGYIGYWLHVVSGMSFGLSVGIAFLFGGLLGAILYGVLLRFLQAQEVMQAILATLAVGVAIGGIIKGIAGAIPYTVTTVFAGSIIVGGVQIPLQNVVISATAVMIAAALTVFLGRTWTGRAMRATAENGEVAELLGVSNRSMGLLSWILGVALAVASGTLIAPQFVVSVDTSGLLLIISFAVAVTGGFGSIAGAVLAGSFVGILTTLFSFYVSSAYEMTVIMLILVLAIMLIPKGIFGAIDVREV